MQRTQALFWYETEYKVVLCIISPASQSIIVVWWITFVHLTRLDAGVSGGPLSSCRARWTNVIHYTTDNHS